MILFLIVLLSGGTLLAGELPSAEIILSNVLARADAVTQKSNFIYTYTRTTRSEQLDEDEPAETKVYVVTVDGTNVATTLTTLNGAPVPPEKQRPERRASEKRRSMGLTDDLIKRYQFAVAGIEPVDRLECYKLTFQPREGLSEDSVQDKIFNRLVGELWIDQRTYEVARLNVRLSREASLWGGIAGVLSLFNLSLTKMPLHPDLWVNKSMTFEVKGRKLFSGFHLRNKEECSNFNLTVAPDE